MSAAPLHAADNDLEAHVAVEFNKDIARKFDLSLSEELRFNQCVTNYSRSETSLALNYSFARKYLKAGIGYAFINKEKDNAYYQNKHRVFAQIAFKDQFGPIKLSWRTKLQSTFMMPETGSYKRNPKLYLRNKLQADYKIVNSKYTPFASFEFYTSLNDADQNRIDRLRSTIGCSYILTRRSSLEAYLRMDNHIQVKDRKNIYSVGVVYSHDF